MPRTVGCGGRQGTPPSLHSTLLIAPVHAPRVYWDLDIQTNAVIKHRGPSEVLPPHPDVELLRSQLILKLRQHYRELCQQREGNCGLHFHPPGAGVGVGQRGLGKALWSPVPESMCRGRDVLTVTLGSWSHLSALVGPRLRQGQ